MLTAEEHTEKTPESPPSKSSMVAKVGIEEEKGEAIKSLLALLGTRLAILATSLLVLG